MTASGSAIVRTGPASACLRLVLLLGAMALLPWPSVAAGEGGRVPLPVLPAADGHACVAPTEVIRREHMNFLLHQRDRTVYQAARGERHSLKGCVACHVSRDDEGNTIPINAPGQFCAECHAYSAVTMDCFECHATRPDSGRKRR